jgi:sugar/nucleoside kinase (ribokinase family)
MFMKKTLFGLLVLSCVSLHACEVLVLAEPIIDRNCCIDDRTFDCLQLEKGESQLIDYSKLNEHIANFFPQDDIALAGSAINVVKGLAKLEHDCAVIGAVGTDRCGQWIKEEMGKLGICFIHNEVAIPTSQCLCFITPDGERTMLTYIGASKYMEEHLLNPKSFENLKFFHLEGYQIFQDKLARAALELAKQNRATISINLATPHLAREKKETYLDLIKNYANIVFCNEAEALAISGLNDPLEACKWLADCCDIAVVTQGGKGGVLHSRGGTIFFQAKKVEVKDTTGAGDLFSSGFIHAYLQGRSLEQCLIAGRDVAAQVVSVYGVDIPDHEWEVLRKIP